MNPETTPNAPLEASRERHQARVAAERQQAHQAAIQAYNKAQAALNDAANLVSYLTDEVRRTLEVCQSFMPPRSQS